MGSRIGKLACVDLISEITMFIFQEQVPNTLLTQACPAAFSKVISRGGAPPKFRDGLGRAAVRPSQCSELLLFFSGFPGAQFVDLSGYTVFLGSQVIKMVRSSVFPGSRATCFAFYYFSFPGCRIKVWYPKRTFWYSC